MSAQTTYGDWRDAWVNRNDRFVLSLEIHRKSPMGETLQNAFLKAAAQSQVISDRPSLMDLKITDLGQGQLLTAEYNHLVSARNLRDALIEIVNELPAHERDHMNPEIREWAYKSGQPRVA